MPNHVTNIIEAAPHVTDALVRTLTREEQKEAHDEERKVFTMMDEKKLEDFEERTIVDFELLIPSPENKEKGGCSGKHEPGEVCWHSWNTSSWGTKWNAYSAEVAEGRIQFETAWSHPYPVIQALHDKFPEERIEVKYADEDFGSNLGHYIVNDDGSGEVDWLVNDDTSSEEECNEFASQVRYGRSYAETRKEWDEDEIQSSRQYAFVKRIEKERGVTNGWTVIRDEKLEVPQDIIDAIQTIEDAGRYEEFV